MKVLRIPLQVLCQGTEYSNNQIKSVRIHMYAQTCLWQVKLLYTGAISVDFEGLDAACSEFIKSTKRLYELHLAAVRTARTLKDMRFDENFSRSVGNIERCAVELKNIFDETDDLSRKLAHIRDIYYETEMELVELAERLPQVSFEAVNVSSITHNYSGNYAAPALDMFYRGNLIKNEEWLDDLVNDFIIHRREQL